MTDRKAILSIDGQAPIELPVLKGTLGQDVIDIGSLGSHGFFTYDPGFSATAACQSDITVEDLPVKKSARLGLAFQPAAVDKIVWGWAW